MTRPAANASLSTTPSMYMSSSAVEVKVIEAAGTIVLNRPDHGNALSRSMIGQITEALDDLYLEKRVRAIILTGAGEHFCVGADPAELQLAQQAENPEEQWGDDAADARDLLLRMLEITKPIIAAVNGPALSIGAALVLAADVVVASESASFGAPDARHGLVAGLAAPLLSFRVGAGHAARLLLTGQTVDAAEARRIGVFHELTGHDVVWARAMQLAHDCAAGAPEANQLTKRLVNETLGENLSSQLASGAIMEATARTTEAAGEGVAALVEGRAPSWRIAPKS